MTHPNMPARRKVGPKLKKELESVAFELDRVLAEKAAVAAREKELKDRIREIATKYDLPFAKGASQYLNVPEIGKALRVTRPEQTPSIDPEAFLAEVGKDLFHELVTVLKVELRLSEWLQAVEEERVTEEQLLSCVKVADPNAQEPITISLAKPFDPKEDSPRE